MTKSRYDCPAEDCRAGSARQSEISPAYYETIPAEARSKIDAYREANRGPLMRCSYCACVYLQLPTRNEMLGWLDSGVSGQHWEETTGWERMTRKPR